MKGVIVNRSKLHMPQAPRSMIASERLRGLSSRLGSGQQLVLVTAPAGYGKTTLLVYTLSQPQANGDRVCWYRLDKEDMDLICFYSHLVEMLFPAGEGMWEEARSHWFDCGDVFSQYPYLNALFCQELWAFHNRFPQQRSYLVFDDFHEILPAAEIRETIQYIINNLPDNFTVLVSSRSDTGLMHDRPGMPNNVMKITPDDLTFTREAVGGLLEHRYGSSLPAGLPEQMIMQTEGWTAAIVLICQLLDLSDFSQAMNIPVSLDRQELLFNYIVQEVLANLDRSLMKSLVKCALLKDFTEAEAKNILTEEQITQLLEACEQKGLFLQKIIGEETTYRFHSLFREALHKIQPQFLSPEELNQHHLKIADYYIRHQVFDRAIEHFIACGDVEAAVQLVTRESANLIAYEAVEELRHWFSLLPEEVISTNGCLLFFKAHTCYQSSMKEAQALLKKALAIFKETQDIEMQLNTLHALNHLSMLRNDIGTTYEIDLIILNLDKQCGGLPDYVSTLYDLIHTFWSEQFYEAKNLSNQASQLPSNEDWRYLWINITINIYLMLGNLSQARSLLGESQNIYILKNSEILRGYTLIFHAMVLHLQDELQELLLILDQINSIGQKYNHLYIQAFSHWFAALIGYRRHDLDGALDQLESSTALLAQIDNMAMASTNILLKCLWQCQQRDFKELLTEAGKALKALRSQPTGWCLRENGLSLFGAIAREAGDFKQAEKILKAAVRRSRNKGAIQIQTGALLHLARLYYDIGDHVQGEKSLRQALDLAEENTFVMFWDLHFPTLVEMAARAFKDHIHSEYALMLITRYYGPEAAEPFSRGVMQTSHASLKGFSTAFIENYGSGQRESSTRYRVQLLGRFSMAVNGIAIPEKEWKTKKIVGVLKYLLLHRGRTVFKNHLMVVFWPGTEMEAAAVSLRAALYELKKVLKKYGMPAEGKDSLLTERKDRLKLPAGILLEVDLDEFRAGAERVKQLAHDGNNDEERKILLERITGLYQGALLEEDMYEDWIAEDRKAAQDTFFTAVLELARIYLQENQTNKSETLLLRILRMDPYHEEACRYLL
ncbi:MAG: BTAD domain-containing putative transcriptional regulator, partial [Syntrophomonadaceae bacterium]